MGSQDDSSFTLQEVLLQQKNEGSELSAGDGSIDLYGEPAQKSKTGSWKACLFILGCQCCQSIAHASIGANLVNYLIQRMHQGNSSAARLASTWTGTCYFAPLLGAFIADSFLGRYQTVVVSSIIYLIGMCALTLSASVPALIPDECVTEICPSATPFQNSVFFFGLYIIGLGMGGIQPCIPPFGADQFDNTDTNERIMKGSFFNWYFFCECFGSLVASSIFVWMQENIGWGIGYGIPTVFMGISLASLLSGSPFYRFQKSGVCKNPVTSICQVIVASVRNCRLNVPQQSRLLYETEDIGTDQKLEHTEGLEFLDKAAILTDAENNRGDFCNRWRLCSVTQVEELKILIRLFPIWATGIIDAAAHVQIPLFIEQGMMMDRRVGSFTIPAASLETFGLIAASVWIPIYDKFLAPAIKKLTGKEQGFSVLQRIGIGYILAFFSMIVSALVEMRRLQLAKELDLVNQNVSVPLSILWQVPQHMLQGISLVFVFVGKLELFNNESPAGMRSLCNAFLLLTVTLGCYLTTLVITIVTTATTAGGAPGWIPDNLNQGRLDVYFWLWAGFCLLNLFVFVLSSMRYKQKKISKNLL